MIDSIVTGVPNSKILQAIRNVALARVHQSKIRGL